VLFVAGRAYYRTPNGDFYPIANFLMSETALRYYVAYVPASTVNTNRYLTSATDNTSLKNDPGAIVSGTPSALVVQDGENQPWILYVDGSEVKARVTQTYEQWGVSDVREYVPIGCDMLYLDGILFVVSADRLFLYRSVTGRPLDFVVNVDTNGYKGGDVNTTKYAVSYNRITAIVPLSDQSFLVSTDAPYTYTVALNRDRTVWGEPTFNKSDLFSHALINSFSMVDLLGDTGFITFKGIRSFNSTLQLRVESKNAIFSSPINNAYELDDNVDIIQSFDSSAAVDFRDYALFSTNSRYGAVVAMYDKIRQKWASFIRIGDGVKVKQFASLMPNENKLFAITTNDKVYELFASATPATGVVMLRDFGIDDPIREQKTDSARLVIKNQLVDGIMQVNVYADNLLAQSDSKTLVANVPTTDFSAAYAINRGAKGLNNLLYEFKRTPRNGWLIGYILAWTGGGELQIFQHSGEINTTVLNQQQQTRV